MFAIWDFLNWNSGFGILKQNRGENRDVGCQITLRITGLKNPIGDPHSPHIYSYLNLSITATSPHLSPRWPLWRGSTVCYTKYLNYAEVFNDVMTLTALDTPLIPNMPGKIRLAKRSWTALDTECDITFFHYVGTDVSAIHLLPMEWRFFKESYKCRCSATKVKEPFCCVLSMDTIFFYKNVQFFELSPDRSYFLASFSLEMFLRMFLNFSNWNLMTLKDQAKIVVVTLMNCTCNEYNINVLLTIHKKNVLKEQNFACILIYGIM